MLRLFQFLSLAAAAFAASEGSAMNSGNCIHEEVVVDTMTSHPNAWGDSQYFVFEYPANSQSAVMIGSKSKTEKGEDSDVWCLKPGQYLLFLAKPTISSSVDYAIAACGVDVKPGSIIMFSLDSFGRCSVLLDMVASDFSPLMANNPNRFTTRELETTFTTDDFGSFDFSGSYEFSTSMDLSMDFSFDFSLPVTDSPTAVPTNTYAPSSSPSSEPTSTPTNVLHPTHVPTVSPTAIPTTAPSFAPTSKPTVAPTAKPTIAPTVSPPPTTAPTRKPTVAPTRKPTLAPTLAPTSLISNLKPTARINECYADCSYKGQKKPASQWSLAEYCEFYKSTGCTASKVGSYECVPSCLNECPDAFCDTFSTLALSCTSTGNTYADKVDLEDTCLDTYADLAETETEIEFTSDMTYDGLDATDFSNSADAQDSAILAMAQSMVGVPADQITIATITATTRRALISGAARRLAAGTKVTYNIRAVLEALGYTQSQSTQAYNSLKSQISESVNNGNFMTYFKAAAQEKGAGAIVDPATVDTSSVVFSDPTTTIIQTASPTAAPNGNSGNGDNVDTGVIVGAVIGSVVGFALIIAALYYFMFQYKTQDQKEMQFRMATNRLGHELTGAGVKEAHETRKASNV